jgi:hypothetical protein
MDYMATTKVQVRLDDEIVARLDKQAEGLGIDRSSVIRMAIKAFGAPNARTTGAAIPKIDPDKLRGGPVTSRSEPKSIPDKAEPHPPDYVEAKDELAAKRETTRGINPATDKPYAKAPAECKHTFGPNERGRCSLCGTVLR